MELPPFDYTLHEENCGIEWKNWHRSFEWYLKANRIVDDDDKFVKLMHLAGRKVQEIFDTLPAPSNVIDIPRGPLATGFVPQLTEYELALEKLNEFFEPKKNSTYERHVFRQIQQEQDEKIGIFAMKLRTQAERCEFGDTLNDNIKDQIIAKCASTKLRRDLLKLGDAKLDVVLKTANIFESVEAQSKTLSHGETKQMSTGDNVNKIDSRASFRQNQVKDKQNECTRCGYNGHRAQDDKCPAKGKLCNKCGGKDHFSRKCRSKKRARPFNNKSSQDNVDFRANTKSEFSEIPMKKTKSDENETVKLVNAYDSNVKDEYIFCITSGKSDNEIGCKVGGVPINVVIDSGSKYNIMGHKTWEYLKEKKIVVSKQRKDADHEFKAYGGHPLTVVGVFETKIETAYKNCVADFYVLQDYGKVLIGYKTGIPLGIMKIGENVNAIQQNGPLSKIKGFIVDIPIREDVKPVAQPYRRVPVPLEEAVDKKIDELLEQGIIEKVHEPSKWISPLVPVPKNGDVRLCVDMRRANEAVERENHPLPTMEDFLPHIGKGKVFTKLDVKSAYHQVEISESSRPITTFITKKGLFRYTRLMFGIACAPELFQKIMEQILAGCEGCLNYMDDIIVYGETIDQLNERVKEVLNKLNEYNVVLNQEKCIFAAKELVFLGHKLTANGIMPTQDKVSAVKNFRKPSSAEEVRSFLGLMNFVGKFIPNLAEITDPLRLLIKKDEKFVWQLVQQEAFDKLKECLTGDLVLGYYNVKNRTQVYADAGPVALGAVLIQFNRLEVPRVIAYASKSLSETEKRYCQTEKEALALVWSVERFHFYLFGRTFELITDHKALETIFSTKSKPCARIERWVLRMQSYLYKVIYKPGKNNIADPLSRLVVTDNPEPCFDYATEKYVNHIVSLAVPTAIKLDEIIMASESDQVLQEVKIGLTENSWSERATVYKHFETELCFSGSILLRGNRIVMPESLRARTIELAHEGHPGITVMKRRLRTKVWWPKIDIEAENFVKKCHGCTMVSAPPPPEPLKRKMLPTEPWKDIALDFLGPLPSGHNLLVVVDYYSRFFEIDIMTKITAVETIKRLRVIFARFGRPNTITLDNGTQLSSLELKTFCDEHGIYLNHSAPYWPQENGEVERQNRSILKRLIISQNTHKEWQKELQDFLLMYRATPHSTTMKTPSEMMFGRTINDKLPQINDKLAMVLDEETRDRDKISKQKGKQYADGKRHAKENTIAIGDLVWLKNIIKTNKLMAPFEPVTFKVIGRSGSELLVENPETKARYRRNVAHVILAPSHDEKKVEAEQESTADQEEAEPAQQHNPGNTKSNAYHGRITRKRAALDDGKGNDDEEPPAHKRA